ncbi:hypothetical protein VIGAN_01279300, partial [Vigna angularis var. angularis]
RKSRSGNILPENVTRRWKIYFEILFRDKELCFQNFLSEYNFRNSFSENLFSGQLLISFVIYCLDHLLHYCNSPIAKKDYAEITKRLTNFSGENRYTRPHALQCSSPVAKTWLYRWRNKRSINRARWSPH